MKKIITFFIAGFFIMIFLCYPDTVSQGAILGLKICSNIIIPSLFPFCVVCLFIIKSQCLNVFDKIISPLSLRLFSLSSNEFIVMLMSFLGGYPVGAKLINTLYKENKIDKNTASVMMCYCVNAGPAFIIIAVGSCILNSKILGQVLLTSHIMSSVIVALVCKMFIKKNKDIYLGEKQDIYLSDAFVESTCDACKSTISICSFIVIFSVIINILSSFNILFVNKYVIPLLEVTTGIIKSKNIYTISALLGWGGICVHFQLFSTAKELRVNKLYFYLSRILHSILSVLVTYIQLKFMPLHIQTLSNNITFENSFTSLSTVYASVFFVISSIVLVGSIYFRKC